MTATLGYTKNELRRLAGLLSRLLPPGGRPLAADEVVTLNELLAKTGTLIRESECAIERGPKVLEWRIPGALAPTMNEIIGYKTRQRWLLGKIKNELVDRLNKLIEAKPGARARGANTQRIVRVTRFTVQPNRIDDPSSADSIGAKLPIDVLVKCGVLADDTPSRCIRRAHVAKTARGNTHVLIAVYEVAAEEVPDGEPRDALVEQVKWVRGKLTQAILAESRLGDGAARAEIGGGKP